MIPLAALSARRGGTTHQYGLGRAHCTCGLTSVRFLLTDTRRRNPSGSKPSLFTATLAKATDGSNAQHDITPRASLETRQPPTTNYHPLTTTAPCGHQQIRFTKLLGSPPCHHPTRIYRAKSQGILDTIASYLLRYVSAVPVLRKET